jgi:uncharacterized protein
LEDERYNENPVNRCFFCKEHLFTDLSAISNKYPGFVVLSGTNYDDWAIFVPDWKPRAKWMLRPFAGM